MCQRSEKCIAISKEQSNCIQLLEILIINTLSISYLTRKLMYEKIQNHLEGLLKYRLLDPKTPHLLPKVSDSVDLRVEVGGKICISNEFPGDADAAFQGTTFQESYQY